MTKYLHTKPGSIEELAAKMTSQVSESDYQQKFKKELEKAGKGIGAMTPAEKKAFFSKIDKQHKAKDEEIKESVNEKKNYKYDSNFFVNDKTDTLKKMTGRQGYNKSTLTDYLAQKSNKKEDDVYFDDTDLVYKDKTVLKNAETKTVDQMLKALQKEAVDNPYAVGMAQAMKSTGDKPPLKKATITKAHDIAKSIKKEDVELNEDMYTDTLIKNFHGAYTRNVRRPKAYSQSLGLILDKIKKMVRPGSNQYKKAIETLKSIEGFDKITDYQSQILKDFKPIRQKAINIMMNIKKELSDLSKVDYNNKQNVNKHIDTLINLNKKLEPEVKEDYTKKEDKDIDELTAAQKKLPPALQKAIKKKEDAKEEVNEARWEIEGRVSYKGVGPEDGFHMVIDAPTESAAEDKAYDELEKARRQRKIGPGGGGGIDDMEIEYIEKTNDRLQPVNQVPLGNSYDPTQKEEVKETHSYVTNKQNQKQKDAKGEKDVVDPEPKLKKESDAYDNDRYMMKKYGGQILARIDNSNTKDGKDHVYAPNAQIAKQLYKQGKKVYREEVEPTMNEQTAKQHSLMKAIYDVWSNSATELEEVKHKSKYMKASKDDISTETDAEQKEKKSVEEANIDVDNVKKGDTEKEKELKIKLDKEKDADHLEKQLIAAQGQIGLLKQKLENEKNKAVKPEPNPKTGEVPLTVGVAYKIMKDKMKKESDEKEQKKNKTMTDKPKTPVDTTPNVDYKH